MILLSALMLNGSIYQLQAEKAKYDGRDLVLSESVEMTHPVGHLSARRAVLQNFKMDWHTPFQNLLLDGQVRVHAVTPQREIDLMADQANGAIDAGALFAFQRLRCVGAVKIVTNDGFSAQGGEARFSALANRGGIIELLPMPLTQNCLLTRDHDRLEAHRVRFDLTTSQILCEEPKGTINAPWKPDSSIRFRAHRLIWDQDLILEGDVSLEQTMTLFSQQIRLTMNSPDSTLKSVIADGPTQMTFKSSSLKCKGPLMLDPQERLLRTDAGLEFIDERVRLEAQTGRLTYQEIDSHWQPEALYCEGSVRLISSKIQDQESFALADLLVYLPTTRTIILTSHPPSRVLFWQANGNMTLSAPEIHVRLDPETKRETVQGIGDVHFRFSLQEEDSIRTIFSKYL